MTLHINGDWPDGAAKTGQNSRDGVFVNPNANQKTVDGAVFGTKILWFARSLTGALKKPWLSTLEDLLPSDQQLRTIQTHAPVSSAIDIMHPYKRWKYALSNSLGWTGLLSFVLGFLWLARNMFRS